MDAAGRLRLVPFLLLVTNMAVVENLSVDCGPRGEAVQGKSHTINCQNLTEGLDVTWRFSSGPDGYPVVVGTCSSSGTCSPGDASLYQLTRAQGRSDVRVLQVERNGRNVVGVWRCVQGQSDTTSAACSVEKVIWPPEVNRNQCSVAFHEYDPKTEASCHITKVFPESVCQWLYNRVGYSEQAVPSAYTKTERREYSIEGGDVFYESWCKIDRMPLPKDEGTYVFRVLISPGAVEPSVVFEGTDTIRRPARPFLTNCTANYIDYLHASQYEPICTCVTSDIGSPPGLIQWIHPDGYTLDTEKFPQVNLLLGSVKKTDNNRSYTCVVRHHTGPVNVTYRPQLSYGPTYVSIVTLEEKPGQYKLKCIAYDVMPKPQITWSGQEMSDVQQEQTEADGSFFTNIITFTVKYDSKVTCTVKNLQPPNTELNETFEAKGTDKRTAAAPSTHATPATMILLTIVVDRFVQ